MSAHAPPSEQTLQEAIDRVWETVPPLWNRIRANVRAIASERFQISVLQFRVLRHIGRGVGSASELATVSQTSRPAISQCVDALVGKGLITRRRSTEDRRCVELALTPEGAGTLAAIFEENHRWLAQKLGTLSAEELACALRGLRELRDAFTE